MRLADRQMPVVSPRVRDDPRLTLRIVDIFIWNLIILTAWVPGVRFLPGEIPSHAILAPIIWINVLLRGGIPYAFTTLGSWQKTMLILSAGICVLSTVGLFHVDDIIRVGRAIYPQVYYTGVFLFVYNAVRTRRDFDRLLGGGLTLTCAILGILLILHHLPAGGRIIEMIRGGAGWVFTEERDRFSGFFKNPNQLGIALASTVSLIAAGALRSAGLRRFVLMLGVLACLDLLVASGSKTNLMVAFLALGSVAFAQATEKSRIDAVLPRLIGTATALGLLLLASAVYLRFSNERAFTLIDRFFSDGFYGLGTTRARLEIWTYSLQMALENPLFGVGAGVPILGYSHSHNVFLEYFRTLGVFGLLMMIGIFLCALGLSVASFRAGRRHRRDRGWYKIMPGIYGIPVIFFISNMTSDSFGPTVGVFFGLGAGLCAAYVNLSRRASSGI